MFVSSPPGRNRAGLLTLWGFVAVLAALYAGSVAGPPPPSERALATAQLLEALVVPWGRGPGGSTGTARASIMRADGPSA